MDFNELLKKLPKDVQNKAKSLLTGLVLSTSKVEKDSFTQVDNHSSGIHTLQKNSQQALLQSLLRGESNQNTQQYAQKFYKILKRSDEIDMEMRENPDYRNQLIEKYNMGHGYKKKDEEEKELERLLVEELKKHDIDLITSLDQMDGLTFEGNDEREDDDFNEEEFFIELGKLTEQSKDKFKQKLNSNSDSNDPMLEGFTIEKIINNDYNNNVLIPGMVTEPRIKVFYDDNLPKPYLYEEVSKYIHVKTNGKSSYFVEFYIPYGIVLNNMTLVKDVEAIKFQDQYGDVYTYKLLNYSHTIALVEQRLNVVKFKALFESKMNNPYTQQNFH